MELLIKSTLAMAVLLAIYYFFLQKEKMYRFNRFYLIATIVFSLALPFITIPVYVEAEQPVEDMIPTVTTAHNIVTHNTIDIPATKIIQTALQQAPAAPGVNYRPYIILIIYALVTITFLTRFIINIRRFYTVKSGSKTLPYRGATLILAEKKLLPYTFLNNIYLNKMDFEKSLIEPELFTHELTHVRQLHTLDILFIEVIKTFFWFNPLLYLYKKAIQLNHEFLADEAVIAKHKDVTDYQELLLTKANPAFKYALSSSINFSLTKKRFTMMTKTTNLSKQIALKALTLLIATGLVYTVCVKTVAYSKETPLENKTIAPAPVESISNNIAEEIIKEIAPVQEILSAVTTADTVAGDARRDEYYKDIRIIINDKLRNIYVDKPYEQLTPEQKDLYLPKAPHKKGSPDGIAAKDYEWYISYEDGIFYIDDKKVSRAELLKHKREDFASSGFKFTFIDKKETKQIFFYTYPYYNKNIKHSNDHYPDKTYKVTILEKPVDTHIIVAEENNANSTNDLAKMQDELSKLVKQPVYPREEEHKKESKKSSPRFQGGKDKFINYFISNFKEPADTNHKKLSVMFAINTDGSLSDITIVDKTSDPYTNITSSAEYRELTKEIERVITNSPRWTPAQQDGVPVKISTTIDITVGKNK